MAECHLRAPPGRDRRTRDRHLHCRLPHSSRHRCRGTLRGRGTDGHPVLPPAGHFAGRRRVHWPHDVELFLSAEDAIDTAINITAIGATTFLALQSQPSETALREQASLLDLTHDSIVARRFDDDVITYRNRGAEELYGWQRAETVGRVGSELRKTAVPLPLDEIKAELVRVGRWEGELVNNKRDGTPVLVTSRWSLQRDRYGRPTIIVVTSNDITERKRAEQALRESEEQWREVFEHNPVMYFMVSPTGTVLSVNGFGAAQLGYTARRANWTFSAERIFRGEPRARQGSIGDLHRTTWPSAELGDPQNPQGRQRALGP
jgi:PAS domain S-box-containing protein